ncbi:MAG: hypothetical protein ACI9G9_001464, partial [Psychromonas sp.]
MKPTTLVLLLFTSFSSLSQLEATFTSTPNTRCDGTECIYSGPSVLFNEIMISPSSYDGNISGQTSFSEGKGEWLEIYNPNICNEIDISCYYIGNNTNEGNGGFVIPPGTVVPRSGFCIIRGVNAAAVPTNLLVQNGGNVVEVVVPPRVNDPGVCASGLRFWFPNAGGWLGLYDYNGLVQDAISWVTSSGSTGVPCIPVFAGCNPAAALSSYRNIPAKKKNYLGDGSTLSFGQTFRRIPDGGDWDTMDPPTYGTCNSVCIAANTNPSNCVGTATVSVSGGTPPYTYQWNGSTEENTETVYGLCNGIYSVSVTDDNGLTEVFQVSISDNVPDVEIDLQDQICIEDAPVTILANPTPTSNQTGTLSGTGVVNSTFDPAIAGLGKHTIQYYFEDEYSCNNTATEEIMVHPVPTVTISNNESPYCFTNTPAALILSPSGGVLTGSGVENNEFTPTLSGAGIFTLTYSYEDANGCSNFANIDVTVQGGPVTLTIPTEICFSADAITMIGSPNGGTFKIDDVNSTDQFEPQAIGVGNHVVKYFITHPSGCVDSIEENIIVTPLPEIQLSDQNVFCFETGHYALTPQPIGGTLAGDNIAGMGIELSGVEPGEYSYTYSFTNEFGCSSSETKSYDVPNPIQPNYEYETDCFQGAKFINTNPGINETVSWSIGGVSDGSGNVFSTNFPYDGSYELIMTITDSLGCTYDSVGTVNVKFGFLPSDLIIPNV